MTNILDAEFHDVFELFSGLEPYRVSGQVLRCRNSLAVCEGINELIGLGEACWIEEKQYNSHGCIVKHQPLLAEVVAIDQAGAHLLPFDRLDGIGVGARVIVAPDQTAFAPARGGSDGCSTPWGDRWMAASRCRGDPFVLAAGAADRAHRRRDLGPRLDLGVRALNLFTPCREGQRMGIFAGSGVGKSTLLAMLARHSDADALVLGLIGERGRELPAFSIRGWARGPRPVSGRGRDLGSARDGAPARRLCGPHRG